MHDCTFFSCLLHDLIMGLKTTKPKNVRLRKKMKIENDITLQSQIRKKASKL